MFQQSPNPIIATLGSDDLHQDDVVIQKFSKDLHDFHLCLQLEGFNRFNVDINRQIWSFSDDCLFYIEYKVTSTGTLHDSNRISILAGAPYPGEVHALRSI